MEIIYIFLVVATIIFQIAETQKFAVNLGNKILFYKAERFSAEIKAKRFFAYHLLYLASRISLFYSSADFFVFEYFVCAL